MALQNCADLGCVSAVHVVDDCSTDGSADVARASWTSAPILNVFSFRENCGQWPATNFGIEALAAEADWTLILHADDVVKENWISLYIEALNVLPEGVASVCSSYDVWYPDGGRISAGEEYPNKPAVLVPGSRSEVRETLKRGCWWHISGCAIRNKSFAAIGPFNAELPMLGDWDWLLRALSSGYGVWYLPRSTMLYRQLPTSVSGTSFRIARDLRDRLQILENYFNQGYLTQRELRAYQRAVLRLLARRSLVRMARRDGYGLRKHLSLLGELAADYLSVTFRASSS